MWKYKKGTFCNIETKTYLHKPAFIIDTSKFSVRCFGEASKVSRYLEAYNKQPNSSCVYLELDKAHLGVPKILTILDNFLINKDNVYWQLRKLLAVPESNKTLQLEEDNYGM